MTEINFTSSSSVYLLDSMGNESTIADAARVSVGGTKARNEERDARLVARLYNEKHGVPFESCILSFQVECPIFISRQLVKHRLTSINEISGRYAELEPKFYLPSLHDNLAQSGKAMDYRREPLDPEVAESGLAIMKISYEGAWQDYQDLLAIGFSNEQARCVLPTSIFTTLRMTANLRSWLNFIELRVDWGLNAKKRSHPQAETEQVAMEIALEIQSKFPTVWAAFEANGYEAV